MAMHAFCIQCLRAAPTANCPRPLRRETCFFSRLPALGSLVASSPAPQSAAKRNNLPRWGLGLRCVAVDWPSWRHNLMAGPGVPAPPVHTVLVCRYTRTYSYVYSYILVLRTLDSLTEPVSSSVCLRVGEGWVNGGMDGCPVRAPARLKQVPATWRAAGTPAATHVPRT